jgi:hypothetical protein
MARNQQDAVEVVTNNLDNMKNPIEGFITYLRSTLDFCQETLKLHGIEVGGKQYKANLKAVPLKELREVLIHEFTDSSVLDPPRAGSVLDQPRRVRIQRSISKNKIDLISIHLIELCKQQISELDQINDLVKSDFISRDVLKIKIASLLINQWEIDNLACGLGLPTLERSAVSRLSSVAQQSPRPLLSAV